MRQDFYIVVSHTIGRDCVVPICAIVCDHSSGWSVVPFANPTYPNEAAQTMRRLVLERIYRAEGFDRAHVAMTASPEVAVSAMRHTPIGGALTAAEWVRKAYDRIGAP